MVLSFRHGTHWHAVLAMATAHTQSHFLCPESHTYTRTLSNIPTLRFKQTFLGILPKFVNKSSAEPKVTMVLLYNHFKSRRATCISDIYGNCESLRMTCVVCLQQATFM